MSGVSLIVTDLAVARGGVPVLEGLNFTVEPGCALILTGPNGSGKTTVLRTLAGLQPPLEGTIAGAGERVAYAGHLDGLKATLTVAENLSFWASVFGTGGIDAALDTFDLRDLAERPAQALSAGQKRRLGLSRLLVTGRPLWLLDEPTVSLDTATTAQFAEIVHRHLAAGGSAVIATHTDTGITADVFDVSTHRARNLRGAFDEALA